ncbi:Uncharacterized membrane protein YhaH, DUF805 family [Kosakonia oryzendophytica]|uniref:Uncharacterized membrane protein YhaH, DUF805 family n=1 Tax=Kosakonia oryzendophytica TaxID=1005665 RepID=A0A1C4DXL0_9ENTR|nr:DUF805 domain-containing protein [Kosakonia oryzendophytica]AMO47066.1 Aminopeptidase C, putative [Enterobacter sp. FY-07]TDT56653.1 uncharacterized membrane protein YhaH (DUF805 family) [Enterobacter sp. AG5470]WBT58814.1 DUF805 domain-containing protein [Kosakonia oryzendophytica]SCC36146.1 Uncharacterized membrane protein YhaH, DUF805 family [Kosakonia oryzendophytica]
MDWYFKVLRNYATFRGRAHRREFWMFTLVNLILFGVLHVIDRIIGWHTLSLLYELLVLVPSLAVQVRRLHDTDRSWRWLLLLLFPVIGWLALLAFYSQHGTPQENRFGPEPKLFA